MFGVLDVRGEPIVHEQVRDTLHALPSETEDPRHPGDGRGLLLDGGQDQPAASSAPAAVNIPLTRMTRMTRSLNASPAGVRTGLSGA